MTIEETPINPNFSLMEISDQRWEDYIKTQPYATIFHQPAWIKLLTDCYGYQPFIAVVCDDAGIIQAGIPIVATKRLLTDRHWVSLPYSDYCNPLYTDLFWLGALINGLMKLAKNKKIRRVELRWNLPQNEAIFPVSKYVLHMLNLDNDIEKVCGCIHRTQYQNVRRAEKDGILIERGKSIEDMRTYYHLHCLTRKRHGLPVQPWRFFELLFYQLLEKGMGFILIGKQSDRAITAGIFLCGAKTLTYKYAASCEKENQNYRSNHLLTWNAICWGCDHGYDRFDFGRSGVEDAGLRNFKSRWGAEESILSYSNFFGLHTQQSITYLMPLMNYIIHQSPLWVSTTLGQLLYKYFE